MIFASVLCIGLASLDGLNTKEAVVTVTELCGYDPATFSFELGERWGVGQKKFDNGVVIMVKPFGGQGQRHAFIAVGYGLEAVIPDAIAKRIVELEMIPEFKKKNFDQGILNGVVNVMSLASGEYTASEYAKRSKGGRTPFLPILFVLGFALAQ